MKPLQDIPETMKHEIKAHLKKLDARTKSLVRPFLDEKSADPWIRDVLWAYYTYFFLVLRHDEDNKKAEETLLRQLRPLVPKESVTSMNHAEEALGQRFKEKGYHFLGGYTHPYRGPYIWKKTEQRDFSVVLPDPPNQDRTVKTTVFFMHDFLLRGWMHFDTCGAQGAGGWAKQDDAAWADGLYCVAECYDLPHLDKDERFQVSLLKHEAQHLADRIEFPRLRGPAAEYRAKLVELVSYSSADQCLAWFIEEAEANYSAPHPYASHRILKGLSKAIFSAPYVDDKDRWLAVDYAAVQTAALRLLAADTRRRRAAAKKKKR